MIQNVSSSPTSLDASRQPLATAEKRVRETRANAGQEMAAGTAAAAQASVQVRADNPALRKLGEGVALTNTAASALTKVANTVQTMRQQAAQAAGGTATVEERKAMQAQISRGSQTVDRAADQAAFNGKKLFDGNFATQLPSGPQAGATQTLALGKISSQSLGVSSLDVTSPSGATNAVNALDKAASNVARQQNAVRAAQAGLNSASAAMAGTYGNPAAQSPEATTNGGNVAKQAAVQGTPTYNANQAAALKFFQKV